MASKAELENKLRKEVMDVIAKALEEHFDTDIMKVGSGEITLALVDAEGNDKYPKIKVSIPRGTRDGEGGYIPYDGIEAAEDYRMDMEAKEQERAVKKAMREAEKRRKGVEDDDEE